MLMHEIWKIALEKRGTENDYFLIIYSFFSLIENVSKWIWIVRAYKLGQTLIKETKKRHSLKSNVNVH